MSSRAVVAALASLVSVGGARDVAAQKRVPGWTMTMNSTIDSGDANHRLSIAVRQQVTARNVRMEFIQVSGSAAAGSAEGMYTILDVVDTTMTMVMPAQRMATVMNPSALMAGQQPMIPTVEMHTTSQNLEDLGPGERMLGHATHHYRLTTVGTKDVTVMGETCVGSLNEVSEMWIAPDVDVSDALSMMGKNFGSVYGAQMPAVESKRSATLPKGTALRTISKTTRPDARGRMVTVTSTEQFVELAHGDLDASLFAPPPDFQKMDMRKMMSKLPAGMLDSAMKAGAETGARASAKTMCNSGGHH